MVPFEPSSRRSLATRMARWGACIVAAYALMALAAPLLDHWGLVADPNAGLANPMDAPPSWSHWCGTDRLDRKSVV